MATITFELSKRVNELGHQELKLRFKHNPIAQRVRTGIFIKAEYFDKVTSIQEPQFRSIMDLSTNIEREYHREKWEQVKTIRETLLSEFNATKIEDIGETWVFDIVHSIVFYGNASIEAEKQAQKKLEQAQKKLEYDRMQNELEEYNKKMEEEQNKVTLLKAMQDFIDALPHRIQKNGLPVSKRAQAEYKITYRRMREFAMQEGRADYELQEMDKAFYDRYVTYLYETCHYTLNTAGDHIKNVKAVINSLPEEQRRGCEFVESRKCSKLSEEIDNIYLTEEELNKIANLTLDGYLDRIRDQFILLSWTGVRYSDLAQINANNINFEGGFIKIMQTKTKASVIIPILPETERILAKYDNGLDMPKVMVNQDFNRYIKDICKLAGLTSTESITRTTNGRKQTEYFEKWQLVSAHTARRSFATNLYKRRFPTISIMQVTGHRTEKAFLTYIKVSGEEHARMMRELWGQQVNK